MQDFSHIKLPDAVLTPGKHEKINFNALEGKTVIGLMGYAKSGKDFITKTFIEEYGYQRVAFADNIKKEMNLYLKELVHEDINTKLFKKFGKKTIDLPLSQIDFFTEDLALKKILRPYIIWYGETLRNINGKFCWINRAFEEDGKNMSKIVLSDVRRLAELDVFRDSNEFRKRTAQSMADAGILSTSSLSVNNYGTLLFEVSQFGLSDSDNLTVETIQKAHEQWLIDDAFMVDPRISEEGSCRTKAIEAQIKRIVKKYGIQKEGKVKHPQSTIFQVPELPLDN